MGRQATGRRDLGSRRCRRGLLARRCTGRSQPLVRGHVDGRRLGVSRGRVGAHWLRACVLVAAARQSVRSAARDCWLRLVPPRVEQPRSWLGARLHGRPVPVRRVPAARRTRRARLPRRPPRLGSRAPRGRDRLRRGPARPRPPARAVLRPAGSGLQQCPRNLLAVSDGAGLWTDLNRVGLYGGIAWALALTVLAAWRLIRASSWARPVFAAGAVYLGLVATWFAASLDQGLLWNGTLETRLWFAQAAALVVLATGVAWNWVRNRRARSTVAQLIVDLAKSPPPGGLRDVLAGTVGDPHLVLAYPLGTTEPTRRCAGTPGRAGHSPGTDEAHTRRASCGRALPRARTPRRRAARGKRRDGRPARARERAPPG